MTTTKMTCRLEAVRDRPAAGLAVPDAHLVGDPEAAGGGPAPRAQEALVEGEAGRRAVRLGKASLLFEMYLN